MEPALGPPMTPSALSKMFVALHGLLFASAFVFLWAWLAVSVRRFDAQLGFWAALREVWPETREQRLGAPAGQRARQAAQAAAAQGQAGATRDLLCGEPEAGRAGHKSSSISYLRGRLG